MHGSVPPMSLTVSETSVISGHNQSVSVNSSHRWVVETGTQVAAQVGAGLMISGVGS